MGSICGTDGSPPAFRHEWPPRLADSMLAVSRDRVSPKSRLEYLLEELITCGGPAIEFRQMQIANETTNASNFRKMAGLYHFSLL